jgi:hypothetical protein
MVGSVRRGPAAAADASTGRLVGMGAIGGLVGGMAMAVFMMIWMAATGAGFWTPLSVGMASLSYRITPPASVMPMLAKMMPAHPSASVMQAAMAMQTGHLTNPQMATLMKAMPVSARNMVMSAMPVQASHLLGGALFHLGFAMALGAAFGLLIAVLSRTGVAVATNRMVLAGAAVAGSALLFVVQEAAVMPSLDPIMTVFPHGAFFVAHLIFGVMLAAAAVLALQPAARTAPAPASRPAPAPV